MSEPNGAIDEFDELFLHGHSDSKQYADGVVNDGNDSLSASIHEKDENPSDVALNTSTKDISPIHWDRVSEPDHGLDIIQVHTPQNEFLKEAEEELKLNADQKQLAEDDPKPVVLEQLQVDILTEYDKLFCNTKYFLIKSNNHDNVDIAKSKNAWATPIANESRLNKAYFDSNNVLLIFSVRESGRFQGFARLASPSDPRLHVNWVLPSRMSQDMLSSPFKLDWITK